MRSSHTSAVELGLRRVKKLLDLLLEIFRILRISKENKVVDKEIRSDQKLADRIEDHNEDEDITDVNGNLSRWVRRSRNDS